MSSDSHALEDLSCTVTDEAPSYLIACCTMYLDMLSG